MGNHAGLRQQTLAAASILARPRTWGLPPAGGSASRSDSFCQQSLCSCTLLGCRCDHCFCCNLKGSCLAWLLQIRVTYMHGSTLL